MILLYLITLIWESGIYLCFEKLCVKETLPDPGFPIVHKGQTSGENLTSQMLFTEKYCLKSSNICKHMFLKGNFQKSRSLNICKSLVLWMSSSWPSMNLHTPCNNAANSESRGVSESDFGAPSATQRNLRAGPSSHVTVNGTVYSTIYGTVVGVCMCICLFTNSSLTNRRIYFIFGGKMHLIPG